MKTRVANDLFRRMLKASQEKGRCSPHMVERTILAFDPGETTGFARFHPDGDGNITIFMAQLDTKDRSEGARTLKALMTSGPLLNPLVVCEDYRVYGHKAESHSWAGLHTPKLIGRIEQITDDFGIPMVTPMAGEAKGFATDELLKGWDLYEPGMRHARDAVRHLVTRLFFGKDPL